MFKKDLRRRISTIVLLTFVMISISSSFFNPMSVFSQTTTTITQMSDTTQSTGSLVFTGRQIIAEYVTPTSQLVGDNIDSITLRLQRVGSPTGTAEIGVFNTDLTVKQLFGTVDVSTLSASYQVLEYKLPFPTFYTIQSGDRIGIKFNGGTASNGVNVTIDTRSQNPFDSTNSYRVRYESSWISATSEDMYMILRWTFANQPPPTVTNVSSTIADGTYTIGNTIPVTVTFSQQVFVTKTPRIQLETGATDRQVNYVSGSGTDTLTFNYVVQEGDTAPDLNYLATNSLTIPGSATIRNAANTDAILTLPATSSANSLAGNKAIVIDTTIPAITNVSSPTINGAYNAGNTIPVTVTFSEAVIVTGIPQLQLETGTTDQLANYVSGSGTATLTFNYVVQAGDTTPDLNYLATNSLTLNGGTIRDAALNNAVLTLPATGGAGSLGTNKNIVIDAVAPTVTNVTSPTANGSYNTGTIPVTVTFSENVNVVTTAGTPTILLETGTTDRTASYVSGTGTNTLTFNYSVQAGDTTPDLNYVATNSLTLNGGTISDAALNDAVPTLPATGAANSLAGNKAIVIDTTSPAVASVSSSTADGSYGAGNTIAVTVTFTDPVTVTGTPQIQLETGPTDRLANYVSGSGTATLTFNYLVQPSDTSNDLDYLATNSLTLNGGTIRDAALNNAILTLANPGAAGSLGENKSIIINTTAPFVTGVSSTNADGTYSTGNTIAITVTFNNAVTVTGTPQIQLETGAIDRQVNYASGTTTNTLTFNYVVQTGDTSNDLDYLATNSLTLNGGTIRDAALNNAILTLATPDTTGSLGATKNIAVNPQNPPIANGQSVNTDENTSVVITLSGSDPNGDPIKFYTVNGPSHGVVSLINPANRQIWYTPWDYYDGPDAFTFVTNDGVSDSAPATVSITVADTVTKTTNRLLVITVLENWDTVVGYYTALYLPGNPIPLEFGFSPVEFDLNDGQLYTVAVSDFGNVCFHHWLDTADGPARDISITSDTLLTAVYRVDLAPPCP